MLDKGYNFGINGTFGPPDKMFSITLINQRQNDVWVCITIRIILISLLTEKKYLSFKPMIKYQLTNSVLFRKQI